MPRFQFSLRTLLIVVTAICLWLGWQVYGVRQRAEVLLWMKGMGLSAHTPDGAPTLPDYYHGLDGVYRWSLTIDDSKLPWYRRVLGDHYVASVLSEAQPEEKLNRIQAAFPEAKFVEFRSDY